jgi:hypothetical protein
MLNTNEELCDADTQITDSGTNGVCWINKPQSQTPAQKPKRRIIDTRMSGCYGNGFAMPTAVIVRK